MVRAESIRQDIIKFNCFLFRCGTEAVVGCWDNSNTIVVVSRSGNTFSYTYDSPVFLVPEIDGVRIISSVQHDFLQKVPDVVQKIFRINSTEPGSFLLEASKQFQVLAICANVFLGIFGVMIFRSGVTELMNTFLWSKMTLLKQLNSALRLQVLNLIQKLKKC